MQWSQNLWKRSPSLSHIKLSVRKEALGKAVQATALTKDVVTKVHHFGYCIIYKNTLNLFSLLVEHTLDPAIPQKHLQVPRGPSNPRSQAQQVCPLPDPDACQEDTYKHKPNEVMTDRGTALWKQIKNKSWLEFYLFSDFWVEGTGVGVKANRNYGLMDTRGQPKWVFSRTPLLYLLSAILLLIFTPTGSAHGEQCMPLTQPWSRKCTFGDNQNQTKTKSWYSPAMSHLTQDPVFDVIWNEYLCDATQCFLKIIFTWHRAVLQAPGLAGFRDMDTSVRNQMTEETQRLLPCNSEQCSPLLLKFKTHYRTREKISRFFLFPQAMISLPLHTQLHFNRVFTRSLTVYKELLAKPLSDSIWITDKSLHKLS